MPAKKEEHLKRHSHHISTAAALSICGHGKPNGVSQSGPEIIPHPTTSSTNKPCPLNAYRQQAAHQDPNANPILSDKENTVLKFKSIIIPSRRPLIPRPKLANQISMLAEKADAKASNGEKWGGKTPFRPCSPTQHCQAMRKKLSQTLEAPARRGSGLEASKF